jgi:uncharacterized protein (DUF362 family)
MMPNQQAISSRRYVVAKTKASSDLRSSIRAAVNAVGGFESYIEPGDVITLKPNLNTADPFPASSDPAFIKALAEEMLSFGVAKIRIIESSMMSLQTRKVAEQNGLSRVADELGLEMVFLDEGAWTPVQIERGVYLKNVSVGAAATEVQKLVLAPCLKTHAFARFTATMKLFVGWTKPTDRLKMHARHLEEKVVDLASHFRPSLVVMDARKVFVSGGPAHGQVEEPGFILAGDNMLAVDIEGLRILKGYVTPNKLDGDIWHISQVKHAVRIGMGPANQDEIAVRE